MKISKKLNDAITTQIGDELKASNAYANMAAYFNGLGLLKLSAFFFDQSEEEREHAMKFVHYLLEVEGDVNIPAIPDVPNNFESVKAAFEMALSWLAMMIVSVLLTPIGGLIAALVVLFLVELMRIKNYREAFKSTSSMAMGCGWAVFARLIVASLMIALFIMWYFLLY